MCMKSSNRKICHGFYGTKIRKLSASNFEKKKVKYFTTKTKSYLFIDNNATYNIGSSSSSGSSGSSGSNGFPVET